MLTKLLIMYLALLVTIYLHELGHRPKKIIFKKWHGIPLPIASAMQASSRYGGLIVNALVFLSVWYFKPEMLFLQLVGALSFIHFTAYLLFGSFNHEPKIPKFMIPYHVFDDVPNEYWYVAVPISILTFLKFQVYFIPILTNFIQGLF